MESDFSDQISKFFKKSEEEASVPNENELRDKLEQALEFTLSSNLNRRGKHLDSIDPLRSIYRRGSASHDHALLLGVSRMQMGLARVIHVLLVDDNLDQDILDGKPYFENEKPEDVFVGYTPVELGLAKVKLTTVEIPENFRDLKIDLEK